MNPRWRTFRMLECRMRFKGAPCPTVRIVRLLCLLLVELQGTLHPIGRV